MDIGSCKPFVIMDYSWPQLLPCNVYSPGFHFLHGFPDVVKTRGDVVTCLVLLKGEILVSIHFFNEVLKRNLCVQCFKCTDYALIHRLNQWSCIGGRNSILTPGWVRSSACPPALFINRTTFNSKTSWVRYTFTSGMRCWWKQSEVTCFIIQDLVLCI